MQHAPGQRLLSLDAFRGAIMLLMASGGFGIVQMLAQAEAGTWQAFVRSHFEHRLWEGCALWDLIQPSFMFMVGIAVPLSCARRREQGQGFAAMLWHAITRSLALIVIAVLLSTPEKQTHTVFVFTNVLAQIGLGYVFLFLITSGGRESIIAFILFILIGTTAWFALHPVPAAGQLATIQDLKGAKEGILDGWFAHWTIHFNAAADFDRWFLNLFPPHDYQLNAGGYQTLNFIPALATMLGGSLTGLFLQRSPLETRQKAVRLVIAGVILIFLGFMLGLFAIPLVKRIWTPSWAIFSGGWVLLFLAFFYWLVEIAGCRRLVFPLVVVGMNSITIYLMHQVFAGTITKGLHKHLPWIFAPGWEPVVERCGTLLVLWLACWWLYRQKAFLKL